jgi:hypothetical protein
MRGAVIVVASGLALAACGDNVVPGADPPDAANVDAEPPVLHDFWFIATRWDELVGAPLRIRLERERDGALVADVNTVAMFVHEQLVPSIIAAGETYTVRWVIDLDADGICDPPPADPAWQVTGLVGEIGLTFEFHPATDPLPYTDVCAEFP